MRNTPIDSGDSGSSGLDLSGPGSSGRSSDFPPEAAAQRGKARRSINAIFALYVAFFLLWCIGLLLGFMDDMPTVFGMPLWFAVSCVGAYVVICFALVRTIRRYF